MPITTIPEALKTCGQYIRRAEDMDKHMKSSSFSEDKKVIAFYCRMYALDLMIPLVSVKDAPDDAKVFVYKLMERLEGQKDEITVSKDTAKMYIIEMGKKLFEIANQQLKEGTANKLTAKTFLHAAHYYEVVSHFGALDEAMKNDITYARTKGTEIIHVIRINGDTSSLSDKNNKNEKKTQDEEKKSSAFDNAEEEAIALAARFASIESSEPSYDPLAAPERVSPPDPMSLLPPTTSEPPTTPAAKVHLVKKNTVENASTPARKALEKPVLITSKALKYLSQRNPDVDSAVDQLHYVLSLLRKK
jgi:hypothetical protein